MNEINKGRIIFKNPAALTTKKPIRILFGVPLSKLEKLPDTKIITIYLIKENKRKEERVYLSCYKNESSYPNEWDMVEVTFSNDNDDYAIVDGFRRATGIMITKRNLI